MKKRNLVFISSLLLISLTFYSVLADDGKGDNNVTVGPENGSLVIVGGAMKDSNIVLKFIELAGGKDAAFVVIPTASGVDSINPQRFTRFLSRLVSRTYKLYIPMILKLQTPKSLLFP